MPITAGVPTEAYTLDTYRNSYGTLILVGDGDTPEIFHIIAGLGDIDGPNRSISVTERLTHSTGTAYKGKDPGMIDAGQIKFPVAYDPANPSHSAEEGENAFGLGYLFNNRIKRQFQIVYAPAVTGGVREAQQFRGFLSELGEAYPVEGRMDRNVTIEIDGPLVDIADYPAET